MIPVFIVLASGFICRLEISWLFHPLFIYGHRRATLPVEFLPAMGLWKAQGLCQQRCVKYIIIEFICCLTSKWNSACALCGLCGNFRSRQLGLPGRQTVRMSLLPPPLFERGGDKANLWAGRARGVGSIKMAAATNVSFYGYHRLSPLFLSAPLPSPFYSGSVGGRVDWFFF